MTPTRAPLQQQRPTDRIARLQQQQSGSNEFRGPPQGFGGAGTPQMGAGDAAADRPPRDRSARDLPQAEREARWPTNDER